MQNFAIPEFVFLNEYECDKQQVNEKRRVVVMHVPSSTIVEVLHFNEEANSVDLELNHDFVYNNKYQISFSIHSTLIYKSESAEMKKIFKAMESWYINYLQS